MSIGWHATSMHALQQLASHPQLAQPPPGHLAMHSGRQASHIFMFLQPPHATPLHATHRSVSQPQQVGHSALLG
jgi:hypothetical protein